MKKFFVFFATLVTAATVFAAARPSLDGRALVAETGDMPKGLFARTVGYLPGDSVAVTNPATGTTVSVLVLGSIDASEGVAILLSPEAADQLDITKDTNAQVKITKRTGSLDESVSGTAIVAEGGEQDEISDISAIPSESSLAKAEPAPVESPAEEAPVEERAALAENPAEEVAIDAPSQNPAEDFSIDEGALAAAETEPEPVGLAVASSVVSTENDKKEPEVEQALMNIPAEENTEALAKAPIDESLEEEPVLEKIVEIPQPGEEVAIEAPGPAEPLVEESPAIAESSAEEFPAAEESEIEVTQAPFAEESSEEKIVEIPSTENLVPLAKTPAEAESDSFVAEIPAEVTEEHEAFVEETPAIAEEEPASSDGYQAISLIPAQPNPPAEDSPVVEEEVVAAKTVVEAPVVTTAAPAKEIVALPSSGSFKVEDFTVASLDDLKRSSYYVQIASLKDDENISQVLSRYAEKYPMAVVPNKSGSAKQVMVGPLSGDEYGTVLERFKAFGFKDAFTRKIK